MCAPWLYSVGASLPDLSDLFARPPARHNTNIHLLYTKSNEIHLFSTSLLKQLSSESHLHLIYCINHTLSPLFSTHLVTRFGSSRLNLLKLNTVRYTVKRHDRLALWHFTHTHVVERVLSARYYHVSWSPPRQSLLKKKITKFYI